jgi:crossover junction endodeoxyribonuclease RusA
MNACTTITLPFPPSVNGTFRKHNGSHLSERYREWRDAAGWELKAQRPQPIKGKVHIEMQLVAPDRRARDGDNLLKAPLDLLVKHGIVEDDSNKFVSKGSFKWVHIGAPCTITVTAAPSASGTNSAAGQTGPASPSSTPIAVATAPAADTPCSGDPS